MESNARRLSVDLTSRILSILSLCVAVASIGYLYTQDRVAGTREKLMASFEKQLAEQSQAFSSSRTKMEEQYQTALDRQDQRLESWNSQLTDSLATFRQDADLLLNRIDESEKTASEQRQLAFDEALDAYRPDKASTAEGEPGSLASPKNNANVAETQPGITGAGAAVDALAGEANLQVVNTVLRPGTGNTTLIVIENNSQQDALIERIRFRPESDFETTDTFDLSADAAASTVTTFTFDASDNTSKKPGYHGIYDRQLQEKIRVRAGERVTLRVMIQDSQYEGWGFAGKLVLEYNAAEPLTVEAARIAFHTTI